MAIILQLTDILRMLYKWRGDEGKRSDWMPSPIGMACG